MVDKIEKTDPIPDEMTIAEASEFWDTHSLADYPSEVVVNNMEPPTLTPAEKLMAEVALNLQALVQHTLDNVAKPPRGSIKEVGHYRVLKKKLGSKEFDALGQVLDELAYNVASTLFATLDGTIESEIPDFPKVLLVEEGTQTPLVENLQQAFADVWEE